MLPGIFRTHLALGYRPLNPKDFVIWIKGINVRNKTSGTVAPLSPVRIYWSDFAYKPTGSFFYLLNTMRSRQNDRQFPDDMLKCIWLNENVYIYMKISLKFVSNGPIKNILALVQIMVWRRPGDKSLYEWIMASLLPHICITRPRWVTPCKRSRKGEYIITTTIIVYAVSNANDITTSYLRHTDT